MANVSTIQVCTPFAILPDSGNQPYSIKNLSIKLVAGFESTCEFEILGKAISTTKPQVYLSNVETNDTLSSICDDFVYGRKVIIIMGTSLLFVGYVLTRGGGISGSGNNLSVETRVTLATSPYFYDNEWNIAPYFLHRKTMTSVPRSMFAYPEISKAWNNQAGTAEDIVGLLVGVLDAGAKSTNSGRRLAEFIDIAGSVQLNKDKIPGLTGDNAKHTFLQSISSQMDSQSGTQILLSILSQFLLIMVPVFVEPAEGKTDSEIKYTAIANCGLLKPDKDDSILTLTAKDVISYVEYAAQKRIGEINNIIVHNPKSNERYWLAVGYDSEGNPVKKLIKISNVDRKQSNQAAPDYFGQHTLVSMPDWMITVGDRARMEATATALATAVTATGGGFSGRIGVSCPVTVYDKVKNALGRVIKLNLADSEAQSAKGIIRYGRLIGVDYRIAGGGSGEISAGLSLTFDCVLNKQEFDKFSVRHDELLCIKPKKSSSNQK